MFPRKQTQKNDLIIFLLFLFFFFPQVFLFQGQPTYDTKNISTNIKLKVTAVSAALCNLGDGGYVKKVKERIKEQAKKKSKNTTHGFSHIRFLLLALNAATIFYF